MKIPEKHICLYGDERGNERMWHHAFEVIRALVENDYDCVVRKEIEDGSGLRIEYGTQINDPLFDETDEVAVWVKAPYRDKSICDKEDFND